MIWQVLHLNYTDTFGIILYALFIQKQLYGPEVSLLVDREPYDSFLFSSQHTEDELPPHLSTPAWNSYQRLSDAYLLPVWLTVKETCKPQWILKQKAET